MANPVAVTAGATTPGINATLAVAGHVTGTVTNASAVGLGGISVAAYRADGSGGWNDVAWTQTAADGSYDLGGLPTGSYRIEFRDDNDGAYVRQYYNNKPTIDLANPVAVTAGATTSGINATLAAAGHVTGTVTNAGAVGLGGINVNAYASVDDYNNGNQVNGTQTAADGSYDLGGLPTGSYLVEFQRRIYGAYVTQFYNNKATIDLANPVAVTAGATTPGINATLAVAGHVTGTVKNASAVGLGGIQVNACARRRLRRLGLHGTQTAADGSYDLGGLPTGSYRIGFSDDAGAYVGEYYNNKPTLDLADNVGVTAGATTSGINATLAVAGHVTGTVTNASAVGLGGINVNAYAPVDDSAAGNGSTRVRRPPPTAATTSAACPRAATSWSSRTMPAATSGSTTTTSRRSTWPTPSP